MFIKRLKSGAATLLLIFSTLIFLAVAFQYRRSFHLCDYLIWRYPAAPFPEDSETSFVYHDGHITIGRGLVDWSFGSAVSIVDGRPVRALAKFPSVGEVFAYSNLPTDEDSIFWLAWHGFHYEHETTERDMMAEGHLWHTVTKSWMGQFPLLPLIMLTAVPPCLRLFRLLRRYRDRKGYCSQCGYDLRATPSQCPECGAAVNRQ